MSTLVPYRSFESDMAGLTLFLDEAMSTPFTSAAAHAQIEDHMGVIYQDVDYIDDALCYEGCPRPHELVAIHALNLRLTGIEGYLAAGWQSEALRADAESSAFDLWCSMFEGDPDRTPVLFSIDTLHPNECLYGYVKTHRITHGDEFHASAVAAPRWVHQLFADPRLAVHQLHSGSMYEYSPSRAVPLPEQTVLETALALWEPSIKTSPWHDLAVAVEAAAKL